MGLIVETGEGIEAANSYVSLQQADAHFAALGLESWAEAATAARSQALIRASQFADFYEYSGTVLRGNQGLKWPRANAIDGDGRHLMGLPYALTAAVLELAPTYLEPLQQQDQQDRVIKEKIGTLELVYSQHKSQPSFAARLLHQIGAHRGSIDVQRG